MTPCPFRNHNIVTSIAVKNQNFSITHMGNIVKEQGVMADSGSSTEKHYKNTTTTSSSFFLNSPRLFTNFTSKGFHETETMMSPTSILDTKPFSSFKSPSGVEVHRRCWEKLDSKGVGLGLVDALVDEKHGEVTSKGESRMVLFGSQLKIQIQTLSPTETSQSIKTRNSVLEISNSDDSRVLKGCLSASEMELSEDYTRVISHGPNPRTTHIFDNCIIESSCFASSSSSVKENGYLTDNTSYFPSESFLSFCFHCNKNLGQGKDIYMYRGERAFCSHECRYQGMLLEEGGSKLEDDDNYVYAT